MLCPSDSTTLKEVTVLSHYGQYIVLDQCQECGGVWFDTSEIHQVKQGEAEKIEKLDETTLQISTSFQREEFLCPKDKNKLICYKDSFFPKNIVMEICPVCHGFWLNKGEFVEYQKQRHELQEKKEDSAISYASEESVLKILENHSSKDTFEALGSLSKLLSTPIDRHSLRPSETSEKRTKGEDMVLDAILTVVRILT